MQYTVAAPLPVLSIRGDALTARRPRIPKTGTGLGRGARCSDLGEKKLIGDTITWHMESLLKALSLIAY